MPADNRTSRLLFAFGVHDHQPVGNFADVIARAHARAYEPFLKTVSRWPNVHFSLHISGSLLEWLEEAAAPTLELVREMVARRQCELLGGTYYEALAPVAPRRDVVASITAFREKLATVFGVAPEGMWPAERVYEPHLPRILAEAAVKHIALDDWHFRAAGFTDDAANQPWLAADQGAVVTVVPISQRLRYMVPFAGVGEVIAFLHSKYEAGASMACLADDGEKFGAWPGTHKRCYDEGWLSEFFAALGDNEPWLHTVTLAEAVAAVPATGPAYLPATSYYEMTRWALPPEAQRRLAALPADFAVDGPNGDLVAGAPFRSFLHKYPEADYFRRRVQLVSDRLEKHAAGLGSNGCALERHLWRAQANDSYWHGVFGGFYLPHLRRAAKEELVRAEAALDDFAGELRSESRGDVDGDGAEEITLKNENVVAVLKSSWGLAAMELALRSPPTVITDVPARRPEAYHDRLTTTSPRKSADKSETIHAARASKVAGLGDYLIYDRRPKALLLERLFSSSANEVTYAREAADEIGVIAWGNAAREEDSWRVVGALKKADDVNLSLEKDVALAARGLNTSLKLTGEAKSPLIFGLEYTLAMTSELTGNSYIAGLDKRSFGSAFGVGQRAYWEVVDKLGGWRLSFQAEPPVALWHAPIFTVSCSESGYEKVYQGSSFFFWRRWAGGAEEWRIMMELR